MRARLYLRAIRPFDEREAALGEPGGEQRNSRTEQKRNDAQVKFIDQIRFEKVTGEFAASHKPDVFARAPTNFSDCITMSVPLTRVNFG